MEKTAHATLQINRGLLQQFGEVVRIDFQDTARIEEAFRYAASQGLTPISVSDSVGSMGGVAPVAQIVRLAHQYDGYAYRRCAWHLYLRRLRFGICDGMPRPSA
jgi:7-keto-8-aminopelargonate synthetase-like enzyme